MRKHEIVAARSMTRQTGTLSWSRQSNDRGLRGFHTPAMWSGRFMCLVLSDWAAPTALFMLRQVKSYVLLILQAPRKRAGYTSNVSLDGVMRANTEERLWTLNIRERICNRTFVGDKDCELSRVLLRPRSEGASLEFLLRPQRSYYPAETPTSMWRPPSPQFRPRG